MRQYIQDIRDDMRSMKSAGSKPETPIPLGKALSFPSLAYNFLLKTQGLEERPLTRALWKKLWKRCHHRFNGPVITTIHGQRVTVNFGYLYPYLARKFPLYNQPLLELVYQAFSAKGAAVNLVDVGAAVGDTILLVEANCPGMIDRFYCVDGDPEFFGYLKSNLGANPKGSLYFALLSSSSGAERALIRTHRGTASAQGDQMVKSCTLDSLLSAPDMKQVDLLKIDVDGFDGRVIAGAKAILGNQAPSVIFEWHPILCKQTGNSWLEHFEILYEAGYKTFVWFTKFGGFSHFSRSIDRAAIDTTADLCLRNQHCDDWHYDVVALHGRSRVDPLALAELRFAKRRRSRC
jgi:FkbM family methyltransferase